jgi:hypothetical protein
VTTSASRSAGTTVLSLELRAAAAGRRGARSTSLARVRPLVVACALVLTLTAGAYAATTASRTGLLLTVKDLPPEFRVVRPAKRVPARTEARAFGVRTARFGRLDGVGVGFKRNVTAFDDRALNEVDISLVFFRSQKGAHAAYRALTAKDRRLFAVHVGDESMGAGLTGPDVNVRWVRWRHGTVVATVVGSYFAGHPNTRSLVDLARKQQRKVARNVR